MSEYLIFQAGKQSLGAAVECVREVVRAAALSNPVGLSKAIEGILNLRGNAVPVIALEELFDFPVPPLSSTDHLVVMSDSQNRSCAVRSNKEVQLTSEAEIIDYDVGTGSGQSPMQQLRIGQLIIPLINPKSILDTVDSTTLPLKKLSKDAAGGNE